jgi:hypothetical protein
MVLRNHRLARGLFAGRVPLLPQALKAALPINPAEDLCFGVDP